MDLQPRGLSFEDDDGNNVSKDDSEEFAVGDTAFFRSTSGASDQPSGGGSDLLSPVASPTPFGTPRVWSAHSLYGEALLHSTRQLSAGNNTCSTTADEDDKILGPQQPYISQTDAPIYEDLLVSPTSPVSDTPTTPPSVAPKPSLSPPPLIQPEMRDEPQLQPLVPPPLPASAALNAVLGTTTNNNNNQAIHTLVPPPESMSYSSRTPLRPPRVPGNPQGRSGGGGAASTIATNNTTASINNNNNAHGMRQHRRNGSDSSFMSALTDVTFGSVQTAPPPPRSLPLPLLSSSSSWTRYTNGMVGSHLPVLDNHVSGMNISVPAALQQPFLNDDENVNNNSTTEGLTPSHPSGNAGTGTGTPLRQSTPPRHRPPKDSKSTSSQQKGARPKVSSSPPQPTPKLPNKGGMSSALAASSQASARQKLQNRTGPTSPSNGQSSGNNATSTAAATFLPIQRRVRSYSSDATTDSQASSSPKIATKPRSYSSDVILPPPLPERTTPAGTQSLPGMCLTSAVPPWDPPCEGVYTEDSNHDQDGNDDDTCGPVQLGDWLVQAYSRVSVSRQSSSTDPFGAALLALEARSATPTSPQADPPLRKIASVTSTVTDVSRLSTSTRQQPPPEARTLEPQVHVSDKDAQISNWPEWVAIVGFFGVLISQGLIPAEKGNPTRLLFVVGFEKLLVLWFSRLLAGAFPQNFDFVPRAWRPSVNDELFLGYVLSRGWPRVAVVWASLEYLFFLAMGSASYFQSAPSTFPLRLTLVAWVAGILETLRRVSVGMGIHALLYRRFCHKMQRTLQHVSVLRSIARFARIPIRDCVTITQDQESVAGQVSLEELVAFQKIYTAFCSDRALSPELGSVEDKKKLKASVTTLYDAIAVQGRVRLSTLQEAVAGNEVLTSLVHVMFPSSPAGVISQADFITSIETLHENVNGLLKAIEGQVSWLQLVDTLSSMVLSISMLCLAFDTIAPLALATLIALICAVALSTCAEALVFSVFARPYELGDVIIVNCPDDLPISHDQGWKVEEVTLWNTKVSRGGMNAGATVLSNASLARCRITTFDNSMPIVIPIRLHIESQVSRQKLKEFRKAINQYLMGHSSEWVDLLSMHVVGIRSGTTEYELRVRHRQPVGKFCSIRQSRVDLMGFCLQTLVFLGISSVSALNVSKDIDTGYNDDLSEDTVAETDNELYFLANSN